ncbi:tRNAHis guanylyltransferase catalytic domain protein [Kalmanozyma brasiliensis GHG001]|uniref:tRNA(His) guanylyltransferase n=1 Tax=Kalmanozyma brasiliensis (strain GHG001) TaxID=1365824 RepID=V5EHD1_KALBG|nr:tRNAHis guanylyltransferase catalytic domain protein [Kalmanozyma brasiliensis GHG001]EST10001.1 tRNAHis guanylyltransferase catalytic domain protein [Kalmanozyma brasiliensis GHG001]
MAGTRFAYVRNFELPDSVIPSVYLVVRIDGKGFHKFSALHSFAKPNDPSALELMNTAARHVMSSLKGHIALAFGESDEYSFLLRKSTTLYNRRESKITTHIVSLFTSAYVFNWPRFFPNTPLQVPPSFDGRLVVYPNEAVVRDYFSWRQADTHINNLYNTTFWALVLQGGLTEQQATKQLEGTVSSDKHEILHSRFGVNYDRLEAIFRKGTTLVWTHATAEVPAIPGKDEEESEDEGTVLVNAKDEKLRRKLQGKRADKQAKKQEKKERKERTAVLRTLHCDIIGDEFWLPAPSPPTIAGSEQQSTSSSSADTKDTEAAISIKDVASSQPWNDPSRLNGAGLGTAVFLD